MDESADAAKREDNSVDEWLVGWLQRIDRGVQRATKDPKSVVGVKVWYRQEKDHEENTLVCWAQAEEEKEKS